MDGSLVKKTRGGKWHERQFQVTDQELCWLKSDNKTKVSVVLASADLKGLSVEVRDVKFGLKQYMFEVSVNGGGESQTVSLAAASENEKRAWMNAIESAAGIPLSGAVASRARKSGRPSINRRKKRETATSSTPSKRSSSRIAFGSFDGEKSVDKATTIAASSDEATKETSNIDGDGDTSAEGSTAQILGLLGVQTGGAVNGRSDASGGGRALSVAETEAQRKLHLKLAGKITIPVFKQNKCGVCEKAVYKTEEILVDSKPYHKRSCFRCSKCKRQLTLANFAAVNKQLYCKTHYMEMFAEAGGRYEVFGDAGFKHTSTSAAHREIAARAKSVNQTNMPSLHALQEESRRAENNNGTKAAAVISSNKASSTAKSKVSSSSKKEKEHEEERKEKKAMKPSQVFAAERTKRQSAKLAAAGIDKNRKSDKGDKKDGTRHASRTHTPTSKSNKHRSKRRGEKGHRTHKHSSVVEQVYTSSSSEDEGEGDGDGNQNALDLAIGNIVKERKASSMSKRRGTTNTRHSIPLPKSSRKDSAAIRMQSAPNNNNESDKGRSESSASAIGRRHKKKSKKKDRSESSASSSRQRNTSSASVRMESVRKESVHMETIRKKSAQKESIRQENTRKESSRSPRASQARVEEGEETEDEVSIDEYEEFEIYVEPSESGSDAETIEEEKEEEKNINDLNRRKSGVKKKSKAGKSGEGEISHAAVLKGPSGPSKTRKKKVEKVGKELNKIADNEKTTHERTFVLMHAQNVLVTCHCSSLAEFDRWTRILSNAVEVCVLEDLLKVAQKKNMIESLQAQMVLEAFKSSSEVECNGFMERQTATKKKKGKWKKRYFVLKNGSVSIKGSKKKKKAEKVFLLDGECRVMSGDGHEIRPEIPEGQAMDASILG